MTDKATAGANAVRHIFLIAIILGGITTAHAQTASQTNGQTKATGQTNTTQNTGNDPLSVTTSSLPSGSLASGSSGGAGGTGSGTASTSTAGGTSGAGSISASASNTSQVPLELPGESSSFSTQSAISTASTASHALTSICAPPVPSTDGGSDNLTEIAGFSLSGC